MRAEKKVPITIMINGFVLYKGAIKKNNFFIKLSYDNKLDTIFNFKDATEINISFGR